MGKGLHVNHRTYASWQIQIEKDISAIARRCDALEKEKESVLMRSLSGGSARLDVGTGREEREEREDRLVAIEGRLEAAGRAMEMLGHKIDEIMGAGGSDDVDIGRLGALEMSMESSEARRDVMEEVLLQASEEAISVGKRLSKLEGVAILATPNPSP